MVTLATVVVGTFLAGISMAVAWAVAGLLIAAAGDELARAAITLVLGWALFTVIVPGLHRWSKTWGK